MVLAKGIPCAVHSVQDFALSVQRGVAAVDVFGNAIAKQSPAEGDKRSLFITNGKHQPPAEFVKEPAMGIFIDEEQRLAVDERESLFL